MALSSVRVLTVSAAVAATALTLDQFNLALDAAGPYKDMHAVRIGAFTGIYLGYFAVFMAVVSVAHFACGVASALVRMVTLTILALVAAIATLLSPLLPSLALALSCKSERLCPDVANPVLWAYLHAVTQLPIAPVVVGVSAVGAVALWSHWRRVIGDRPRFP